MPDLTFNEFQRELRSKGIDGPNAYMFTLVYERLGECMKQTDETAKVVMLLAEQLQAFCSLRELDMKDMENVKKRIGMIGKTPGIDVHSVAREPDNE
jgi:hypothetical protein